jgi:hypothetical protein
MVRFCSSLALVIACVGCGSPFSATEGGGSAGFGGQSSAGGSPGTGEAGDSSSGGSDSGGSDSGGNAGSANRGGDGGAATAGSGGSTSVDQCTKLKQQYQTALEKARACDLASTDECSPSSTVEPLGCGCPVLVNSQSESTTIAKKARQAYRDAKCSDGTVCPLIACAQPASVSCAPGKVTADTFVCTAGTAVAN